MTTRAALLQDHDLFLFDMDGTLVLGDAPLPGAVDLMKALRTAGKTIRFITNNTLHEPDEHAARLNKAGIEAKAADVTTPLPALLAHVATHNIANAHVIASDVVKSALRLPDDKPQAVILGLCRNWDYAQLQRACNLALDGLPFVMCQPDPYCPDPNGPIPDSGALLSLIETTICKKLSPIVLGKPSAALIEPVLKETGIATARAILFGDRLKTDMALADAAHVKGALVLTGQTKRADVPEGASYFVFEDLTQLS